MPHTGEWFASRRAEKQRSIQMQELFSNSFPIPGTIWISRPSHLSCPGGLEPDHANKSLSSGHVMLNTPVEISTISGFFVRQETPP